MKIEISNFKNFTKSGFKVEILLLIEPVTRQWELNLSRRSRSLILAQPVRIQWELFPMITADDVRDRGDAGLHPLDKPAASESLKTWLPEVPSLKRHSQLHTWHVRIGHWDYRVVARLLNLKCPRHLAFRNYCAVAKSEAAPNREPAQPTERPLAKLEQRTPRVHLCICGNQEVCTGASVVANSECSLEPSREQSKESESIQVLNGPR